MAGVEYVVLKTSRIADSDRADQSGADGGDVIGWVKTADFILGIQIDCEKGPIARAYKLQWRDVTAAGSFADVGATTEISYAATTVLVDGAALAEGNKLCTGVPAGSTWQNGMESEGDNELPDSPDTFSLADEYYTEFQWALDCSGAIDLHEYEFQLYDVTQGVAIAGACPSTITMRWPPPVSDIDVGSAPLDRTATLLQNATIIDKNNPANDSGTLHTVKIWANVNMTGLRVGTFYPTDGNTLKCRDSVVIGNVTAGAERTFTELSITVVAGDYIGCYFDVGRIEADTSGFAGRWSVAGEYIDQNDETVYTFYAGYAISLYGYGDIGPVITSPTVTTQAVTDIAPTTATGNGNITDTGGVDCSKRGVCWNTTGSPTVADDKSEETDSFGTGAFTRPMTGLTPEEHYYVRAYAYNSEGYGYGAEVEFDTTWQPPVSDIDVGADPIDRDNLATGLYTRIDKNNPANASGTIHSVKVWAAASMTGLRVGTFYTTNGNTLKCRDSVLIGDVVHGAERTFTGLSITVVEGDYLGSYFATGSIERSTTGFDGIWDIAGEYIDPNDEAEYAPRVGDAISLYGYEAIAVPGLENKSANMAAKMVAAGLI